MITSKDILKTLRIKGVEWQEEALRGLGQIVDEMEYNISMNDDRISNINNTQDDLDSKQDKLTDRVKDLEDQLAIAFSMIDKLKDEVKAGSIQ